MQKCNICGNEVNDGLKFCSWCGHQLDFNKESNNYDAIGYERASLSQEEKQLEHSVYIEKDGTRNKFLSILARFLPILGLVAFGLITGSLTDFDPYLIWSLVGLGILVLLCWCWLDYTKKDTYKRLKEIKKRKKELKDSK